MARYVSWLQYPQQHYQYQLQHYQYPQQHMVCPHMQFAGQMHGPMQVHKESNQNMFYQGFVGPTANRW